MDKIQKAVTEYRALGTLHEDNPQTFEIETAEGKKTLSIYPLQLGRLAMISRRLLELDLILGNDDNEPFGKMLEICASKARQVAEIIAIATLRTKEEIEEHFEERTEELLFSPSMTPQAVANVLFEIVQNSYYSDFIRAIRSAEMLRVEITPKTQVEQIAPLEGKPFGEKSTK